MHVSMIICTRNRAESLRQTLKSFECLEVPVGFKVDLLVVDNCSDDHTKQVILESPLKHIPVRYQLEERKGASYARNRGMKETTGEIILFTDDDVRPLPNWIGGMCQPLIDGKAEAVQGGVRAAPELFTPWLANSPDKWMVALTKGEGQRYFEEGDALIGASMCFVRSVLEKVPGFDVEVGPGALGSCEDTIFTKQLQVVGYRCYANLDLYVEHHFDPKRLTKEGFLNVARAIARSSAYIDYHFEHKTISLPQLKYAWAWLRKLMRPISPFEPASEVATHNQVCDAYRNAYYGQYLIECRRPRNYERHGLRKIHGIQF